MQLREQLLRHQSAFGIDLGEDAIRGLERFHEMIVEQNPILHLVAPCSVEEFAIRHLLESTVLTKSLPTGSSFADIGTGAGLPAIPCLIVRPDLHAVLIESKLRKSTYLTETIAALGLADRARVENRQFEEIRCPDVDFVTSRALDKFAEKLGNIIRWVGLRPMRIFGGPKIEAALKANRVGFESQLIPHSEQRYLFVCEPVVSGPKPQAKTSPSASRRRTSSGRRSDNRRFRER